MGAIDGNVLLRLFALRRHHNHRVKCNAVPISIGHIEIAISTGLRNVESNLLVRDPEQEQIIRFECRDFEAYLG